MKPLIAVLLFFAGHPTPAAECIEWSQDNKFFHTHYTNAMISDDGGRTWMSSEPFPVMGTGEACIAELADGTLHYNTRRHWAPTREDAIWRWTGESKDGWIYLLYEGGPKGGCTFARFNLTWVLDGEKTGNGEVPEWILEED